MNTTKHQGEAKAMAAQTGAGNVQRGKIKGEHYDHMSNAIKQYATRAMIQSYRTAIVAEGKAKDVEKRLRWDLSYAAGLTPFICDNIYSYANDQHIDTALRSIIRAIEA